MARDSRVATILLFLSSVGCRNGGSLVLASLRIAWIQDKNMFYCFLLLPILDFVKMRKNDGFEHAEIFVDKFSCLLRVYHVLTTWLPRNYHVSLQAQLDEMQDLYSFKLTSINDKPYFYLKFDNGEERNLRPGGLLCKVITNSCSFAKLFYAIMSHLKVT